jgi:glycosyltransferase involved in cell wall biosynthesis
MVKNISNTLHFDLADAAISPTQWQADSYPAHFRKKITVIHDGIDTKMVAPNPKASIQMKTRSGEDLTLTRADEVVTFVNRNLEPYRGYHVFMRALPSILKARRKARVIIVGGNDVSYGAAPPEGKTWKDIFIAEVRPKISDADWSRVHFVGKLPYAHYLSLLQISTVHVYLTYPFVLSWSLLEAMSVGCTIVASDTAPVREVIQHKKTGLLVDFFNSKQIAEATIELLSEESKRLKLSQTARKTLVKSYDLAKVSLPAQLEWVNKIQGLAGNPKKRSATNTKTRTPKTPGSS